MRIMQLRRSVLIASLASSVLVGGLLGAGVVAATSASESATEHDAGVHQKNARGLTIGNIDESPDGEQPDLIAITTSDGRDGYAYSLQIYGRTPETPEEAESRPGGGFDVPVYEADGTTQIGTARIN